MKKIILIAVPWFFAAFSYKALAQEDVKEQMKAEKVEKVKEEKNKKESQEIVIRRNGNKNANLNIQINGDEITVNGKPISEFKEEGITINNRKMMMRDALIASTNGMNMFNDANSWSRMGGSKVFLGVNTEKTSDGAKITEITKESPAEKAGLKKGDVITRFDEKNIDGPQALYDAVNEKEAKADVKVTYKRDGKEQSVKATLQERKNDGTKSFSYTTPDGNFKTFTLPKTDLKTYPKIQQWHDAPGSGYDFDMKNNVVSGFSGRPKLGLKIQDTDDATGVKVLEVDTDSPAAKSGLKKDDLITEIGGEKITNTDEARHELFENSSKAAYNIKAKRGGSNMSFDVKIPKKLKTANL